MKNEYLKKYLEYITNAKNPTIEQFEEDWEPIGRKIIWDLISKKLIEIKENKLFVK